MVLGIAGSGVIVGEVLSFIDEIEFEKIYICGRESSKDKLEALAKKYHLDMVYTDYQEMLKSDVDVVYVGVLNDLHYEYTKAAIEAKKHVICEKPITNGLTQFQELVSLAKKNQVYYFEAMSLYHMPAYKQLQQDIKLAGDLKLCVFNYSQMSSRYGLFHSGQAVPPVFDPAHNGGALMDLNVYNISAMVGLFGTPKEVTYSANMEKGIDTSGVVTADYGDFKVLCIGAKDCVAPGPSTIQGVDATICIYPHVNGMTEYDVLFNDADTETKEVSLSDGSHRLFFEFQEFKRIIKEQDAQAHERLLKYSEQVISILDDIRKA